MGCGSSSKRTTSATTSSTISVNGTVYLRQWRHVGNDPVRQSDLRSADCGSLGGCARRRHRRRLGQAGRVRRRGADDPLRKRSGFRLAADRGARLFDHAATRYFGRLPFPLDRYDRPCVGFRAALLRNHDAASATRTATRCCSAFATSSSRPCHPRHLRRCSLCRRRLLRRRHRRRCRLLRRRCLRRRHLPHRLHRRRLWRRSSCSSTSTASI